MDGIIKKEAMKILDERFGKDSIISVATMNGDYPAVRMVDGFFKDGSFYIITYDESNKMRQIKNNSNVAICGEWFTATGKAESLGWVKNESNTDIMNRLRKEFASWYDNGHIDENDMNTCLLCIRLEKGVLFNMGTRYDIDFLEAL